ncbi:hypothetical protein ACFWDK_09925 [Micromonospora chalcea]
MTSEEVRWSDVACFVGRSDHIPSTLADLSSPDKQVRSKAFRSLMHDLAWNENVCEATPYAIREIAQRLERREIANPEEALALLGTLGNGEAAHPELIYWHGRAVDLLSLCRELMESNLKLYVSYLSHPSARLSALRVISTYRVRAEEAQAELRRAADLARSTEERKEIMAAIDDLREWNEPSVDEPTVVLSGDLVDRMISGRKAAMMRISQGDHVAPVSKVGPFLSARRYLIRHIMRLLERSERQRL